MKKDHKHTGPSKGKGVSSSTMERISHSWDMTKKVMIPRLRELRGDFRHLRKSKLAMVGLIMILVMVGIAVLAPILAPPYPDTNPMLVPADLQPPKPPGAEGKLHGIEVTFPLGTGESGEDIYYGVIWGARTSIYSALFVISVAVFIGIVLGAFAGYYGGAIDELLMRITDIFLSLPALILAMAVVVMMKDRTLDNILLALIIVWWPAYARIVRGQVLSVRENTYVEAARAVGAKRNRILFRHIVPNSLAPMVVQVTMDIGSVVLTAAALSYIGFSQPHLAEWGRLISAGQAYMFGKVPYMGEFFNPWWMWVFPGIFIFVFVMGFNLFGDGLRDIMDPRLRRS